MSRDTCIERYYPAGAYRSFECGRPAKALVLRRPYADGGVWGPACGIHAKRYVDQRPWRNAERLGEPAPEVPS